MKGFERGFFWGAATSSYQIEGAAFEDGKGSNIWDVFSHEKNRIYNNHNGDAACDHYHRFKEDVGLMKKIGLKAYRFSINWARILPNGTGEINMEGVCFYRELITELNKAGIEPFVTLYHWELPYELYKRGGWLNPECVNWFGEYAGVVADLFSDIAKYYFTFNEPQCFIGAGFLTGNHAPGVKLPVRDTFIMAHNMMMAHGQAVKMLRDRARQDIKIGYAPTGTFTYPETDKAENIEAARRLLFELPDDMDNWTWNISWFSDPILLGSYPEEGLKKYKNFLPEIKKEDLALMSQPLDFLGQNIYNGIMVKSDEDGKPQIVERSEGFPRTAIKWPITPECLYWGPKFLYERYNLPIYITENGLSCHDVISLDGKVHDPNRIDFLCRYLKELRRASADGVDIKGYFLWSLMDNFEWAEGYSERFGITFVNFQTQERIIKDSGMWYKKVIESNGEIL